MGLDNFRVSLPISNNLTNQDGSSLVCLAACLLDEPRLLVHSFPNAAILDTDSYVVMTPNHKHVIATL